MTGGIAKGLGTVTFFDKFLGKLFIRKTSNIDDNYVDRLSRYYTVSLLMFYNLLCMSDELLGEPIYCWCPAEFTETMEKYVKDLCWVHNTYYIPSKRQIPANYEVRKQESVEISYYQWVPLMMFLMSLFCFLPRLIWKLLMLKSGFEVKKMCQAARVSITVPERQEKVLYDMSCFLDLFCSKVTPYRGGFLSPFRERFAGNFGVGFGRHYGNYFITCKIFVRFLYFANAIGQLFFLNEFLGQKYYLFGFEVMESFFEGKAWVTSHRFPRMTLCDIDIRQLINLQRYTFQCVLPFNLYHEKFFLFLWFWFSIMTILSLMNLIFTIITACIPTIRETFVEKYLKMIKVYDKTTKRRVHAFIHSYLKQDGIFVLKQISGSSNTAVTETMFQNLWKLFLKRYEAPSKNGRHKEMKSKDDLLMSEPLIVSNGTLAHIYHADGD